MRKTILTFSFFTFMTFGVALISSCKPCGNEGAITFQTANFTVSLNKITGATTVNTFEFFEITPLESDRVSYDSLMMLLDYELQEVAYVEAVPNFGNRLYACDPAQNYDRLESYQITSDQDYNSQYPAGADLSAIFRITFDKGTSRSNTIPLGHWLNSNTLNITIAEAPDFTADHTFTITFNMQPTRSETFTVPTITISP